MYPTNLFSASRQFIKSTIVVPALLIGMSLTAVAEHLPVSDDFSSGDDAPWTRFQPLAPFGSPGTYSFPAGAYRIQAATPSPDAATLGPARAGSLRNDASITTGVITWDLVDWDDSLSQIAGGLARIREVGIGTTDGYGLVYGNGDLDLLRFDNEAVAAEVAPTVAVELDPMKDYRFVFSLDGDSLMGQIFDLAAPGVVVASISGIDGTYASGVTGLLVANSSPSGNGTADATFDNFNVVIPEPTSVTLALLGFAALLLRRRRSRSLR